MTETACIRTWEATSARKKTRIGQEEAEIAVAEADSGKDCEGCEAFLAVWRMGQLRPRRKILPRFRTGSDQPDPSPTARTEGAKWFEYGRFAPE